MSAHPDCPNCGAEQTLASATGGGLWCVSCATSYTAEQVLTHVLGQLQEARDQLGQDHEADMAALNEVGHLSFTAWINETKHLRQRVQELDRAKAEESDLEQTDFDLDVIEQTRESYSEGEGFYDHDRTLYGGE